uniref:Chromo domain-containing protein n=1 Tax=Solanum lycopersicum TaxID=4081 RepID=A0A3Q7JCP8_SOLLC
MAGDSIDEEVDRSLVTRELKIQLLKFHLHRAQQRMEALTNKGRSGRQLHVGDSVYLKIQPYRQTIVSNQSFTKLSAKFYGPYKFTHPPIVDPANPYCEEPWNILGRRMIKKGNKVVAQLLIQWKNMFEEEATWEDYHVIKTRFPSFILEDKEVSKEEVMMQIEVEESYK